MPDGTMPDGNMLGRTFLPAKVMKVKSLHDGQPSLHARLADSTVYFGGMLEEIICPFCQARTKASNNSLDAFPCECGQTVRIHSENGEFLGWF